MSATARINTVLIALATPFRWLGWALFSNDDDGPIGDRSFNPARHDSWRIRSAWWLRNPFHNLHFYVLGIARRPSDGGGVRSGSFRAGIHAMQVFSPEGGFNVATTVCATSRLQTLAGQALHVAFFLMLILLPWWLSVLLALPLMWLLAAGFRLIGLMPFLSYRGRQVKWYIGWRERGNFGLKLART